MRAPTQKKMDYSVEIPAQPHVVAELSKLINDEDFNFSNAAKIVAKDPALVARVLKVVNSPVFGMRRKIDSIDTALNMMGLKIFQRAVLASALREAYEREAPVNWNMFWTHSELVAGCCELIANKFCRELSGEAFLLGLFHDCGIPLMLKRFQDYGKHSESAMSMHTSATISESKEYGTNHAIAGYYLTKSWGLSESIRNVILNHHYCGNKVINSDMRTRQLFAVLRLSEYVVKGYDSTGNMKSLSIAEWLENNSSCADVFGFTEEDIDEVIHSFLDMVSR